MGPTRDAGARQFGLALERPQHHALAKETREALIQALADLLLEAFGDDVGQAHQAEGEQDEPEADV